MATSENMGTNTGIPATKITYISRDEERKFTLDIYLNIIYKFNHIG